MKFYAKTFEQLSAADLYEILKSRAKVFFLEQKIQCLDMDDTDYQSTHLFLQENGQVIAYLRAFYKEEGVVKIGRVLTIPHGEGLGRELMTEAMPKIKEAFGCEGIILHSQIQAEGFYEKLGFKRVGDVFLEEGIEHIEMNLKF